MRPAILAIGVVVAVLGVFLYLIGFGMINSISTYLIEFEVYRENIILGGLMFEALGGTYTAVGLGVAVFGAVSKKKEPTRRLL